MHENIKNQPTSLKTNEYPLKIDGWKMKFPLKMVPFQGRQFVNFRVGGGYDEARAGHLGFYDFQVGRSCSFLKLVGFSTKVCYICRAL